jgi:hypothetical protein
MLFGLILVIKLVPIGAVCEKLLEVASHLCLFDCCLVLLLFLPMSKIGF